MNGNFTPLELAEILRDILITERSGNLQFKRSGVSKVLGFCQGMIATAESSLEGGDFLSLLVSSRRLSPESAHEASGIQDDPQALGRFLIEKKFLDEETLGAAMDQMIGEMVVSLFKWESGSYELEEKEILMQPYSTDVLRSVSHILKGIQSIQSFHSIQEVLFQMESPLKMNEVPYLPVESLAFGPLEGFVISRVDGRTSLKEICSLAPGQQEEKTCRFLYGLLVLGLVGLDPPMNGDRFSHRTLMQGVSEEVQREKEERKVIGEFYQKVCKATPWEILGISHTDTIQTAKTSSEKLRKRFRLENFSRKIQTQLREELEIIDGKVLEGLLAVQSILATQAQRQAATGKKPEGIDLKNIPLRKELSKTDKQADLEQRMQRAEQFYQKGRECFATGDYHTAIEHCANAIRNHPENAAYFALLGSSQKKNPDYRWQKRAEDNFLKAIDLDPWHAEYYVNAGIFYRDHDMKNKAIRHMEKALEIQPNHPVALQELNRLKR